MSSNSPIVHLRLANPSDHDTLTAIATDAFIDCPIDSYVYPRRHQFPEQYAKVYLDSFRFCAQEPDMLIVLAETANNEGPTPPTIAGFAMWSREGKQKKVVRRICDDVRTEWKGEERGLGWLQKLRHRLDGLDAVDTVRMLRNPAVSSYRAWRFPLSSKDRYLNPDYKDPEESWYLNELAVSSAYQRRGIGAQLVQWGLEHAQREKLPVWLHSTPVGRRLYEKMGFEVVGWWKWGKEEEQEWAALRWDSEARLKVVSSDQSPNS